MVERRLSNAAIAAEKMGYRSLGETPHGWVRVTEGTYPTVHKALCIISHDGGGGYYHHWYNVPKGWADALARFEVLFKHLSPEQLETLAIGEQSETEAIIKNVEGLEPAHRFLNAFFEDFVDNESIDG